MHHVTVDLKMLNGFELKYSPEARFASRRPFQYMYQLVERNKTKVGQFSWQSDKFPTAHPKNISRNAHDGLIYCSNIANIASVLRTSSAIRSYTTQAHGIIVKYMYIINTYIIAKNIYNYFHSPY